MDDSTMAQYGTRPSHAGSVPHRDDVILVAFVNFNSGGKAGKKLVPVLQRQLGSDRVFNLAKGGPQGPLIQFQHPQHVTRLRVMACGGDGTVNWILSTLNSLNMTHVPVGIIPLGTGNDTSIGLGWGAAFPGLRAVPKLLEYATLCPTTAFDRWHAAITHTEAIPASVHFPASVNDMEAPPVFLNQLGEEMGVDQETPADKGAGVGNPGQEALSDQSGATAADDMDDRSPVVVNIGGGESNEEGEVAEKISPRDEQEGCQDEPENKQAPKEPETVGAPQSSPSTVDGELLEAQDVKEFQFNNYLSFGGDAQVALTYHNHRESNRGCYPCRCCNMAWIGVFGVGTCMCCLAKQLELTIEMWSDEGSWRPVDVSGYTAVILLNCDTYGGGRRIWGKGKSRKKEFGTAQRSASDGLIDVIGVKSPTHLAFITAKLTRGVRLAQSNQLRVTSGRNVCVQLDGEPWEDTRCTFYIRRLRSATMMVGPKTK